MKRLVVCFYIILGLLTPIAMSGYIYAQDPLDPACQGAGAQSTTCRSRSTEFNPISALLQVVQILVLVTGVASVIMIMVGGFRYVISAGDPSNINAAKNTILYAIIGLVVAVFAQAIIAFVLNKL